MAFPILAAVAAGATAAKGGAKAYAANQQRQALLSAQRAQVRQENRLGRLQDQQDFDAYNRQVEAETEAYELRKETAARQIALNNSAYQRTIETGLTSLADLSDNFIAAAVNRRIKIAKGTGGAAASGMTGVTADRASTAVRGAGGRQEGTEDASKQRAVGQYIFNTELAREQVEQANFRAYASVAIPPTFGPPPVSRGLVQRPKDTTGTALMSDLVGVAADTAMTFVSNMPTKATIPPPGGGNGFSNPMNFQPIEQAGFGLDTTGMEVPGFSLAQAGLADASGRSSLMSGPAQYFTSEYGDLGQFLSVPIPGPQPVSAQLLDGVI